MGYLKTYISPKKRNRLYKKRNRYFVTAKRYGRGLLNRNNSKSPAPSFQKSQLFIFYLVTVDQSFHEILQWSLLRCLNQLKSFKGVLKQKMSELLFTK